MKKLILSLAATLAAVSLLQAQKPDYRFGKVSEEELRMERYDRDPDAEAVVLCEEVRRRSMPKDWKRVTTSGSTA